MGGHAYAGRKKATVDDYFALDMADLAKAVDLAELDRQRRHVADVRLRARGAVREMAIWAIPGEGLMLEYAYGNEVVGDIVAVVTTRPYYGGERYWFLCPEERCGRRVRILYGGKHFLCRKCHGLTDAVCQQTKRDARRTAIRNRMGRIRRKLKAEGGLRDPLPDKPPRMHQMTALRLELEYDELRVREQRPLTQMVDKFVGSQPGPPAPGGQPPATQARSGRTDLDAFLSEYAAWQPEPAPADKPERLTLGELAVEAGVPYAFAKEALQAQLLRPDQGRTTRRKRYRLRLASWLAKLYRLRQAGLAWDEIRAWTERRWAPGHEHERIWPAATDADVEHASCTEG